MPTRDARDEPAYALVEAAASLALPVSTVRAWSLGQRYRTPRGGEKEAKSLIRIALHEPPTLSFFNLVEVYVLASLRRKHDISMQRVRRALDFVVHELPSRRPFIEEQFYTDGADLFVERYATLVNVSRDGQAVLRETLKASLRRVERDAQGLVLRLSPWLNEPHEPRVVEIDPSRAFGRLVVIGTGIPARALAERFRGGESVDDLARDYGLDREKVEGALRWEQCALAA